jgi:multidrug efflux pump subunit AcrA (membrane-fusion protein)
VLALLAAALFVPLPHYVECPFTLEPRGAASVYVGVPGTLEAIHVRGGQRVAAGEPLVTLASLDVELALAQLAGQREELAAKVDDLRRRQFEDSDAAMEVAEAEESLRALDEQLAKRQRDRQRLSVAAPASGTVLPPARIAPPSESDAELAGWSGTPLAAKNLGATLDEGVLVCRVGDPQSLQATIDIDQSQVEYVRPGQLVYLKLDALPGDTLAGRIAEVAELDRSESRADSAKTREQAKTSAGALGKLLTTKYQASAALDDDEGVLFAGACGTARIRAGYLTAGQRLVRYLSQTFRFER